MIFKYKAFRVYSNCRRYAIVKKMYTVYRIYDLKTFINRHYKIGYYLTSTEAEVSLVTSSAIKYRFPHVLISLGGLISLVSFLGKKQCFRKLGN